MAALENGSVRQLPPRSLVLTLDDGDHCNYDLLATFRALPARPTVFLCSGLVDSGQPFWFDVVEDPEPLKRMPDEERLARLDAEARKDGAPGRATSPAARSNA